MKKFNFLRKFSDSINPKQEDYTNIIIKRSKKKAWIKELSKMFIIVFLSAMLGAFISVYIIVNKYVNPITEKVNKPIITNDMINDIQNYAGLVVQQVASSVVTIGFDENNLALGIEGDNNVTGAIIRSDGYILTSYSAIENHENIYVKLPSSGTKPFIAEVVGVDKLSDLAIVKIEVDKLPKIKFADSSTVKIGDRVIAIGNTDGDEYVGMVTSGIVTSINKKVRASEDQPTDGFVYSVVETDAVINSDNNGGVLCNLKGEIVGINSLHLSKKFSESSLNYALNIEDVKKVIDSILSYKESSIVSLGIDGVTFIGEKEENVVGVYVKETIKGGSSQEAGIRPNDIIIELDKVSITRVEDIVDILSKHQPGDIINCKYVRDDVTTEVMITLQEKK